MFLDGAGASARMVVTDDSTWAIKGLVVARRGTTQESAAYEFTGAIDNQSGTVALVSAITPTAIEDTAGWDLTVTADDANNSLKLGVTGAAAAINWVAYVQTVQVTNETIY